MSTQKSRRVQPEPGGFGQGVHKRGRALDLIRGGWPCGGEGWVEGGVESIEVADPLEEDRVTGQKPEGCGLKGVFSFDF